MASQAQPQDILDPSKNAENLFKALIDDTVVSSKIMLDKAQQKDSSTLCRIGNIYYSYENQEFQLKGFGWYLLSAESNYPESQYNIGQCYSNGLGVKINYPLAMVWYKKAAENNYTRSFFKIGFLYHYGMGEAVDYKEARKWYVKAATFKDFKAEFNMGVLYEKGLSVTIDQNAATVWYSRSAMSGFHLARMKIKHRMKKGIQPNLNYASVKSQQAFEELSMTCNTQEITLNKSDTREILVDEKNQTMKNMLSDENCVQDRPINNTSMASQKAEPMQRRHSKTLVEVENVNQEAAAIINNTQHVTNIDPTLAWRTTKNEIKIPVIKPQQITRNISPINKKVVHRKPVNRQKELSPPTQNQASMLAQEINEMMENMAANVSKIQCEGSRDVPNTLEVLNEDNMVTNDDVIKGMLQDSDDMISCETLSMDGSADCNSEWSTVCADVDISALIQQKMNAEYNTLLEYADGFYSVDNMFLDVRDEQW